MTLASYPFVVPDHLHAFLPAEIRSNKREAVKLLVQNRQAGNVHHDTFENLSSYLKEGDVLILNNSRTIPAVIFTTDHMEVRLARKRSSEIWDVLYLHEIEIGDTLTFTSNVKATVLDKCSKTPLISLRFSIAGNEFYNYLYTHGTPIHYEYLQDHWPLQAFQTVYSSVPGSIEMPSAGRALSWKMLADLQKKGVEIGFVYLHTGLSYFENDHWPDPIFQPEPFHVPKETVELIHLAKNRNSRIIAVGTTVVRALESAVDTQHILQPTTGETTLHIKLNSSLYVVDGLLTGFHEPEASHLDMLSAFIDQKNLLAAYEEAIRQGYLWHEFGDMNLLLPMEN
ncbi:S-adenosylmethionine:tRNA ribosyltransferase-isomerase [Halalkalibacter alkaliphilus]|uniref:S-adenosylmethionine:tRNA ribosyltransferase-isomerase n=1 Tax=Halalkalibacter alkaliphilus TaxID=2917993 RepID=A0A9X2CTC5_9BACI|nr:S-adenosylmethionine:tRNA ribosyltransferase-isomerase [Halalkalibacter alkaliphilus]MCL7747900.1 S-adenosylmethionine:tRNA ribosyltransferase-isomerase [Halalkalibacter alkaliphilus]